MCELIHGSAPEGAEASHLCEDNWLCVNPDHLLWETKIENIARRDARRRFENAISIDAGVVSKECPF
jgi:hypothetical protein